MKGYYHVSSHGLEKNDIFKSREDFIAGMRLRSGEVQELIHMAFRKESIVQLSMDQRLKLCLLMKKNFNAGVRQIARVTRLDPELVAKVV